MRSKVGTVSREPAQPGCTLAKSSFHLFQRMQPPLPSQPHQGPQPSQPMGHMPHMGLSTWSTLFWLSCKCFKSQSGAVYNLHVLISSVCVVSSDFQHPCDKTETPWNLCSTFLQVSTK